jgi:hypothetical protein
LVNFSRVNKRLYEELLIGNNVRGGVDNSLIMRTQEDILAGDELSYAIDSLDLERLRKLLIKIALDFKPQCEISDILYKGC